MKTNRLQIVNKVFRILPFILLALTLTQCKGPRGDNGIDGINYTHSVIYDISSSDWSGDINGYTVTISVPEITDDIYYNGAVLVYRLIEIDPKSFNLLPYTYVDNSLSIYMDYDVYVGSINLMFKEVENGENNTTAPGDMSFKVVIIDGINLAGLKSIVDVKNYNAVSRLLNINKNQ
ncbi:MAG: hypothetical protein ABR974_08500 [Bacteroidales bacterium]|jgi:hypothetical protein